MSILLKLAGYFTALLKFVRGLDAVIMSFITSVLSRVALEVAKLRTLTTV